MAIKGRGERVALCVVREAHSRGEYEDCLLLCDAFQPRGPAEETEVTLLRARCLVLLERGAQAIDVLRSLRLRNDQHDENLTVRMLMSAAYLGLGQVAKALEIAREAYENRGDAHALVRAEVATSLGVAQYRNGLYAQAERILASVPKDADIVHAKAMLYRGYVAWARGDYGGSVERFRETLHHIDTCEHHDRFVQAETLYGLTFLAGELPKPALWYEVQGPIERFDWSVSGVATWRYWIAVEGSFVTELIGDLDAATVWARLAEDIAPDDAARIVAWCRLAARFGRYGETAAHAYFVDKAHAAYDAMKPDARRSEQRALPLAIAEEIVYGEHPMAATPLLTYYAEAVLPTLRGHASERTLEASHAMILGHFEERRGNRARAEEAYLRSFEQFQSVGFMRRAAVVAYRLTVLTGDPVYEAFIGNALLDASERYWIKSRLMTSQIESRLSKRHLEILPLVAQGMTNKEIGDLRGGSELTARNTVREAIRLLGVRNRAELASVAAQRGLLKPATSQSAPTCSATALAPIDSR